MKQLQFKDHSVDMFITVSKDSLRILIGMLSVRVALDTLEFDDEKFIISSYIDFSLLLEEHNYHQVKDTVTNTLRLNQVWLEIADFEDDQIPDSLQEQRFELTKLLSK